MGKMSSLFSSCFACKCRSSSIEESSHLLPGSTAEIGGKKADDITPIANYDRQPDYVLHHSVGGAAGGHCSLPENSTAEPPARKPNWTSELPAKTPLAEHVVGIDSIDSGIHSKPDSVASPSRGAAQARHEGSTSANITTERGKDLLYGIRDAYRFKDDFDRPTKSFLERMDKLFMDCQVFLTELSSRDSVQSRGEADAVVEELTALRNHWGTQLLPLSVCNAFVRERIYLNIGMTKYRIDCAQFFEPVPFYTNASQSQNVGDLMKLYRFSVYDLSRNDIILRYYLERSNVIQLYHVLCYTMGGHRGQVAPFGTECPSYWDLRKHMINDLYLRLNRMS